MRSVNTTRGFGAVSRFLGSPGVVPLFFVLRGGCGSFSHSLKLPDPSPGSRKMADPSTTQRGTTPTPKRPRLAAIAQEEDRMLGERVT